MKKERLLDYLKSQNQSDLLELLISAFDTMDTNQRHDVFGQINKEVPPSKVDGKKLLSSIKQFKKKSLAGHYYAPFEINSKNYTDIPEETDEWFEELGDNLEDSSRLTDHGEHKIAVQCFQILYELIDKMEDGEEIVFADEMGSWMIPGDEKRFIRSFLTSLSEIATPEKFTSTAIPLIKRDSYESFCNKVYSTALKIATPDQKTELKREVKKQKVKTR